MTAALLSVGAIALAAAALWLVGRARRDVEKPGPANNWRNEDFAEFEEGKKLRSESVSPLDDGRTSF